MFICLGEETTTEIATTTTTEPKPATTKLKPATTEPTTDDPLKGSDSTFLSFCFYSLSLSLMQTEELLDPHRHLVCLFYVV